MNAELILHDVGPGVTIQDAGRRGFMALGLSIGGAVDRLALAEGAALLGQPVGAALEMAGLGGTFEVTQDCVIALTGAPMRATLDGAPLDWNVSHTFPAGAELKIGATRSGSYGYVSFAGGIATAAFLDAQSAHLNAGIGAPLRPGTRLPLGAGRATAGMGLSAPDRFQGGALRIIPSAQTHRFSETERHRLTETSYTRDPRSNRMGLRLSYDGVPFAADNLRSILSETVVPGDIQIAGDGTPFVLLCEHQTTGGYPRIATVIPADLPRAAQTRPGDPIRFQFITRKEALVIERIAATQLAALPAQVAPRLRDPHDIADLLSYQLISGAITGEEL